jgi:integrase
MSVKSDKKPPKPSRTNPILDTVCNVSGYPDKLKVFKVECSKYWQARVYVNGAYRFSSLKTESKKEALRNAINFYESVLANPKASSKEIKSRTFAAVGSSFIESQKIPTKLRRYHDDRQRFTKELLPYFAEKDIAEISNADVANFAQKMQEKGMTPGTTNHYLIVLRKILKYGADNRLIHAIPNFPKIKGLNSGRTKRDYFDLKEMGALTRAVDKLVKDKVKVRGVAVTLEVKYLIQFMVNSFIRPSDLRVLKLSHIRVVPIPEATNPDYAHYLVLSHPATKTTDQEVVTMPAAYRAYKAALEFNKAKGFDKPNDYLFLPEYSNRNTMIAVLGRIFRRVVETAGVQGDGEKHTLYSLRHSSIMFRLMLGQGINTLQLAKNARTSQAMIERFYASRLTNLMGVNEIHSFKAKPKASKKQSSEEADGSSDIGYVDEPVAKVKRAVTKKVHSKSHT